jgi:hypothetical protein
MKQRRTSRALALPVVLASLLLVLALVGGSVWHTHHDGESSANCQTCHLSHQTAAPQLAISRVSAPVSIGMATLPADVIRVAGPSLPLNISRAPPQA